MKQILNPFFLYIFSFGIVFILYLLHWSNLFPPLSMSLITFFVLTFIISFFLGFHIKKCRKNIFSNEVIISTKYIRNVKLIFGGYMLEFIYAKHIPIISIFNSSDNFIHFGGIPTFHVLLVTYNIFLSSILFYRIISSFNKVLFLNFCIITVFPPLLMVNRGMFFTMFLTCLFIYLFSLKKIDLRKTIYCCVGIFLALYIFALIGSARIKDDVTNRIFVTYTQPTDEFNSLGLSNMFLWPYMYVASPLGNLQTCINEYTPRYSLNGFFLTCICPDFIAKKISITENEKAPPLISPTFNVSTMYYDAYVQYGYLGMLILYFIQVFYIYIIFLFSKSTNNPYYTVTISLMCSVIILNTFSNMWVFSAISFPIIWGPVSLLFKRIKWS